MVGSSFTSDLGSNHRTQAGSRRGLGGRIGARDGIDVRIVAAGFRDRGGGNKAGAESSDGDECEGRGAHLGGVVCWVGCGVSSRTKKKGKPEVEEEA